MNDSGHLLAYLPIFVLLGVAIFLGFVLTSLSRLFGPFRPNKVKESVYESGMDPVGTAHERFSVKFFLIAMLFILFDIEIVFMYPWAVNFRQLSVLPDGSMTLFPLVEMFLFVILLFVGYIYVWKKGGLDWD